MSEIIERKERGRMAFSKREKRLAWITFASAIAVILMWGGKLISSRISDSSVSSATQQQFLELFAMMDNVDEQKTRNLALRNKLGNEKGTFIEKNEAHKFVAALEQTAGMSGMQIKSYSYNENMRTRPMPRLDVKLSMQCQYEQLIPFLDNLRNCSIVCQVTSIKSTLQDKNRPDLDVQLTVSTYLIDAKTQSASPAAAVARG
ncbi:MAG: type 4a pilus biogenesis protein PilO [Candidatus Omnitrophota bacterium]